MKLDWRPLAGLRLSRRQISALAMLAAAALIAAAAQQATNRAQAAREVSRQTYDRLAAAQAKSQANDAARSAGEQLLQALADAGALAAPPHSRRDRLRALQYALRVPGLHPAFGEPAAWPDGVDGIVGWQATPLQLEFELLHEGDLLDFLTRLEAEGALLVRACQLRAPSGAPPLLHASCDLQWLSVAESTGHWTQRPIGSAAPPPVPAAALLGRLWLDPAQRRWRDRQRWANPGYRPLGEGGETPVRFAGEFRAANGRRMRWRDDAPGVPENGGQPELPVADRLLPATGQRESPIGSGRLDILRHESRDDRR